MNTDLEVITLREASQTALEVRKEFTDTVVVKVLNSCS